MNLEPKRKSQEDERYFNRIEQNLIDEGHTSKFALIYNQKVVAI